MVSPHDGAKASGQGVVARHRRRRSEANAAAASVLARRRTQSEASGARRDLQHARRGGPSELGLPHLAVRGEATVGRAGPAPFTLHYTASHHTYCGIVALRPGPPQLSSPTPPVPRPYTAPTDPGLALLLPPLHLPCISPRSRTTAQAWSASCAPRAACTTGAATWPAATTRASPASCSAAAVRSAVR